MSWLSTALGFLGNLFGWLTGRDQAAQTAYDKQAGVTQQVAEENQLAAKSQIAMGDALAEAPKTHAALDADIEKGNF